MNMPKCSAKQKMLKLEASRGLVVKAIDCFLSKLVSFSTDLYQIFVAS